MGEGHGGSLDIITHFKIAGREVCSIAAGRQAEMGLLGDILLGVAGAVEQQMEGVGNFE